MTIETLLARPGWISMEHPLTGNIFESYEISPDKTTFTFQMRRGMRWSDGEPLTTEDVAFYPAQRAAHPQHRQPLSLRPRPHRRCLPIRGDRRLLVAHHVQRGDARLPGRGQQAVARLHGVHSAQALPGAVPCRLCGRGRAEQEGGRRRPAVRRVAAPVQSQDAHAVGGQDPGRGRHSGAAPVGGDQQLADADHLRAQPVLLQGGTRPATSSPISTASSAPRWRDPRAPT